MSRFYSVSQLITWFLSVLQQILPKKQWWQSRQEQQKAATATIAGSEAEEGGDGDSDQRMQWLGDSDPCTRWIGSLDPQYDFFYRPWCLWASGACIHTTEPGISSAPAIDPACSEKGLGERIHHPSASEASIHSPASGFYSLISFLMNLLNGFWGFW